MSSSTQKSSHLHQQWMEFSFYSNLSIIGCQLLFVSNSDLSEMKFHIQDVTPVKWIAGKDFLSFFVFLLYLIDCFLIWKFFIIILKPHLSITGLNPQANWVQFGKSLPTHIFYRVVLTFSSSSFSILGFKLMSLIYWELIFVQCLICP